EKRQAFGRRAEGHVRIGKRQRKPGLPVLLGEDAEEGIALSATCGTQEIHQAGKDSGTLAHELRLTMDYESAVVRLLHHASIGMTGNEDPATSFTYALWHHQTHASSFDFKKLFREIIDCLEVVNR